MYVRQEVAGVDGAFVLSEVLTEEECYEVKQGIIKLHAEAAVTRTAKFAEVTGENEKERRAS
jgi:hypothetical protein